MNSPDAGISSPDRDAVRGEVEIVNGEGLHLRPATAFASLVANSGCVVRVESTKGSANGASVLELAMLAAPPGTRLTIHVAGEGCAQLLDALTELVASGFKV